MNRRTWYCSGITVLTCILGLFIQSALAIPVVTALTDISGEDVAKQIDLLGSPMFATRQAAEKQLIDWAGESLENFQLVREIVNAHLAGQGIDLETRRRLNEILAQTGKLGATITIDDRSDTIKVTSDGGNETTIAINNQAERVEIQSPFFSAFDGPTKIVVLFEPGAPPDENGFVAPSDTISFRRGDILNPNRLEFDSDTETVSNRINCNFFVCIPETGKPQDVAKLIFGDKSGFLVLNVISDVEIPEPASLALLGSGFLGLAGVVWRRHRKQ